MGAISRSPPFHLSPHPTISSTLPIWRAPSGSISCASLSNAFSACTSPPLYGRNFYAPSFHCPRRFAWDRPERLASLSRRRWTPKGFHKLSCKLLHLYLERSANHLLPLLQRQAAKGRRFLPTALLPSSLLHSSPLPTNLLPPSFTNLSDQKIIGIALIAAAVVGFAR